MDELSAAATVYDDGFTDNRDAATAVTVTSNVLELPQNKQINALQKLRIQKRTHTDQEKNIICHIELHNILVLSVLGAIPLRL